MTKLLSRNNVRLDMNTDFPTVEIPFIFAMTYCKVVVYKKDEKAMRNLIQFLEIESKRTSPGFGTTIEAENEDALERMNDEEREVIDTRVLTSLFFKAIPFILQSAEEGTRRCSAEYWFRERFLPG